MVATDFRIPTVTIATEIAIAIMTIGIVEATIATGEIEMIDTTTTTTGMIDIETIVG